MSRALDAAMAQMQAVARRQTRAAVKQGARRYVLGIQSMALLLPGIDELPPEDVLPALVEARDAARAALREGRWYASTSRVLAARAAVLAVRWIRRYPDRWLALREQGRAAA